MDCPSSENTISHLLKPAQTRFVQRCEWFWNDRNRYAAWLKSDRHFTKPERKSQRDAGLGVNVNGMLLDEVAEDVALHGRSQLIAFHTASLEAHEREFELDEARARILKRAEKDGRDSGQRALHSYIKNSVADLGQAGSVTMAMDKQKGISKLHNQITVMEKLEELWFSGEQRAKFRNHLSFLGVVEAALWDAFKNCPDPRLRGAVHSVHQLVAPLGVGLVSLDDNSGRLLVELKSGIYVRVAGLSPCLPVTLEHHLNSMLEQRQRGASGAGLISTVLVDRLTWNWHVTVVDLSDSRIVFRVQICFTYAAVWKEIEDSDGVTLPNDPSEITRRSAFASFKHLIREYFLLMTFGKDAEARFGLVILLDMWSRFEEFQIITSRWNLVAVFWALASSARARNEPFNHVAVGLRTFFHALAGDIFYRLAKGISSLGDESASLYRVLNMQNQRIDPFLLDYSTVDTAGIPPACELGKYLYLLMDTDRLPCLMSGPLSKEAQDAFRESPLACVAREYERERPDLTGQPVRPCQHSRGAPSDGVLIPKRESKCASSGASSSDSYNSGVSETLSSPESAEPVASKPKWLKFGESVAGEVDPNMLPLVDIRALLNTADNVQMPHPTATVDYKATTTASWRELSPISSSSGASSRSLDSAAPDPPKKATTLDPLKSDSQEKSKRRPLLAPPVAPTVQIKTESPSSPPNSRPSSRAEPTAPLRAPSVQKVPQPPVTDPGRRVKIEPPRVEVTCPAAAVEVKPKPALDPRRHRKTLKQEADDRSSARLPPVQEPAFKQKRGESSGSFFSVALREGGLPAERVRAIQRIAVQTTSDSDPEILAAPVACFATPDVQDEWMLHPASADERRSDTDSSSSCALSDGEIRPEPKRSPVKFGHRKSPRPADDSRASSTKDLRKVIESKRKLSSSSSDRESRHRSRGRRERSRERTHSKKNKRDDSEERHRSRRHH